MSYALERANDPEAQCGCLILSAVQALGSTDLVEVVELGGIRNVNCDVVGEDLRRGEINPLLHESALVPQDVVPSA